MLRGTGRKFPKLDPQREWCQGLIPHFNHRSFQKPDPFSPVFGGCLERSGSLERMVGRYPKNCRKLMFEFPLYGFMLAFAESLMWYPLKTDTPKDKACLYNPWKEATHSEWFSLFAFCRSDPHPKRRLGLGDSTAQMAHWG